MIPSHTPRLDQIRIRNFGVLRDVTVTTLTPLTVLVGPNGSGKSTILEAVAFLHDVFTTSLAHAWDQHGGMDGIRSRGATEPVHFELTYRTVAHGPIMIYRLQLDEIDHRPVVLRERLVRRAARTGRRSEILWSGHEHAVYHSDHTTREVLAGPDVVAAAALGQLRRYPQITTLRRLITGWHSAAQPTPTPVMRDMAAWDPARVRALHTALRSFVPELDHEDTARVAEPRTPARLLADRAVRHLGAEGAHTLLTHLAALDGAAPATVVGIDTPEDHLAPQLHHRLGEHAREAAAYQPVLITTRSPHLLNALRPNELQVLRRDPHGFTQIQRAATMPAVTAKVAAGAPLGSLWMDGQLDTADPHALNTPRGQRTR